MEPYGYIYKTTEIATGKIYIGQSTCLIPHSIKQYYGSGKLLTRRLKKYKRKSFVKTIISYWPDKNSLDTAEKMAIMLYQSRNRNIGYNIDFGGTTAGKKDKQSRIRQSNSLRKTQAVATQKRLKLFDENHKTEFIKLYNSGMLLTDIEKHFNISGSIRFFVKRYNLKRKAVRTQQARKNISNALKGHTVSPETRKKLSGADKSYTKTEEFRKIQSKSNKNRKLPDKENFHIVISEIQLYGKQYVYDKYNVAESSLCHRFKKNTGYTISQYFKKNIKKCCNM